MGFFDVCGGFVGTNDMRVVVDRFIQAILDRKTEIERSTMAPVVMRTEATVAEIIDQHDPGLADRALATNEPIWTCRRHRSERLPSLA